MIKKLLIVFIALIAIQSKAQQGGGSPYSFYGIGSLKFKGSVENRSMGGMAVYKDSIHINFTNPATFGDNNIASFKNESRPVKYTVGGSHSASTLKSNSSSDKSNTTSFDYLALSVPINKFGFGFGLLPYSSVGYKLNNFLDNGNPEARYEGSGGVNKVFLSAGYQLTKSLSIGANADYNFGNIENSTLVYGYNTEGDLLSYHSKETNSSSLSGLSFNFGLHFREMISDKLEIQSSFTYAPESNLTSKNERLFSTVTINFDDGTETFINQFDADLEANNLDETTLTLPSKYSIGVGLGQPRKWFAGIEYTAQQTSKFNNPLYANTGTTFEDASKLSIGGFYIPEYNAFSSYWKKTVYRAGLRFENTGLNINNQTINEFGMSFGVGLPVGTPRTPFSNANIGLEFGRRGTTDANLIKENFVNINISLSLNDWWFQKRKYN